MAASELEDARRREPVRELRESAWLLAFMASALGAFVGLGVLAARLTATVR